MGGCSKALLVLGSICFFVLVISAGPLHLFDQHEVYVPAEMSLEIEKVQDMQMGSFLVGGAGGSVTITSAGGFFGTGAVDVIDMPARGQPAQFSLTLCPDMEQSQSSLVIISLLSEGVFSNYTDHRMDFTPHDIEIVQDTLLPNGCTMQILSIGGCLDIPSTIGRGSYWGGIVLQIDHQ
ncbi:DUF4402 domain-containing protein [Chitinivibrio alkaliphilus]|uniref:Uncharacterized protein n=1 Tax=Chitinivibrio alkaliphilus ACht1 TaxID=1313304 RepID=U7D9J1_9BACT|nr:DUF4402 domain-containing protein [Chitinivibrio alkaliphilus]ERP38692.1 hypothetical protein CALK_0709 [Chitinivibrio alkaliphilus ACht1]